jgi:hypothetical protein
MKLSIGRLVWFCAIVVLVAGLAEAAEKKVKRSDLPAEVRKTVDVESQGTEIQGFSQEIEHGKTYYEAEMISSGFHRDVLIDSEGQVVEIEQEISIDALPSAVRSAIQAKAGKGTVKKVESLTKRGKLVAYEAQVVTNGKKSEIQVGPGGESLAREE